MVRLPAPRLTARDAAAEAVAGVVARPGRAVLTMLGTVLGVGAFVGVLGLTATGAGQISHQFTILEDTTVTVEDNGPANSTAAPGYEQQLVNANQQALTAAVQQYRAMYAKELSKLGALLKTAKAQPFRKQTRVAPRSQRSS